MVVFLPQRSRLATCKGILEEGTKLVDRNSLIIRSEKSAIVVLAMGTQATPQQYINLPCCHARPRGEIERSLN